MLLDKYLPEYTYATKHAIRISASRETIAKLVDDLDISGSPIIRFLFWLRGMPPRMLNKEGLNRGKFVELETVPNSEMILGLIGQFWKANGNLQDFEPHQFQTYFKSHFLKAVWNFKMVDHVSGITVLETETRVLCMDKWSRKKFSRYWFFVRPFSGLIRMEMLRAIKKKAEQLER